METIHVKFDELTGMASECNNLELGQNRLNFQDLLEESTSIPIKEDLDYLFGPIFKEYYETRQPEVTTNSAATTTLNNENTPLLPTIVVDDNEAHRIYF
ncbi:hypothetical protein Tco_0745919 [Tanacetum coccineum]